MKDALAIGPLVLVGVAEAAAPQPRAFKPRHGRYSAIKVLAIVRGSHDVTVTLPSSDRDHVSLLYDPIARANRYGFRFSDGDSRVTFEFCSGGQTQYNGGFIAKRPGCVKLEVDAEGSVPMAGWISLGAGRACPPA